MGASRIYQPEFGQNSRQKSLLAATECVCWSSATSMSVVQTPLCFGLSLCTVPTYSTVGTIGLRCRRDYTIALSPACMMRSSTQVQNSKKNHTLALCRSRKWSGMKRLDVSLVLKLILRSFFYCNMFFKLWCFHLVSEEKKHLKTIKCKLCSVEIFSNWRHLLDLSEKQGTSI